MFEGSALDLIFDLAITQDAFKSDELPLLESLGELREIPPGIDAVPFGAILVVALFVLPAFLGCDVEDDVLAVVLSGFGFCVLSETADEDASCARQRRSLSGRLGFLAGREAHEIALRCCCCNGAGAAGKNETVTNSPDGTPFFAGTASELLTFFTLNERIGLLANN